jgi:membrane protein implicated in regulation of membrane protease activity
LLHVVWEGGIHDRRRARHPDEVESAQAGSVTLGLLPAPELPKEIAEELANELPELLSQGVDDHVSWDVSVVCDPLTGSEADAARVIDTGHEQMLDEGWDLAICMTDLPLRLNGRPIVAAVSAARKVAVLSLPPLGVTFLRRQAREAIVQLVDELYEWSPELLGRDGKQMGAGANAREGRLPDQRPRGLVARRLGQLVSPIWRITSADEDVDVRFVSPTVRGHLRLLGGMVLANRPWRLFTTMKGTLAAAFATAAYALLMPVIWQMADSLSWVRLLLLMVLSVAAMVVWIIVAHNLWERPADQEAREQALVQRRDRSHAERGGAVLIRGAVRARSRGGGDLLGERLPPIEPRAPGRPR